MDITLRVDKHWYEFSSFKSFIKTFKKLLKKVIYGERPSMPAPGLSRATG
ncbi:MAG: hypothetical protein ACTSWN_06985 [Promethearchaeota archaeon]